MKVPSASKSTTATGIALVLAAALWGSLAPALAGGRLLSVDDVLTIKVVSQPDLDTTARVETDGTINFPYAGRIRAVGRSEDDVARIIADKLREADVVKEPKVLVELANFGAQATVSGAVGTPGPVVLDRSTTLTQAISRAGGLRESAGDIFLKRPGRHGMIVYKYSSRDLALGKVNGDKIHVSNNDEIYVDSAPFYYLYGFVNKAGQYLLTRDLTVQQAIAAGGGIGQLGTDWRINIKRQQPDGSLTEFLRRSMISSNLMTQL